MKNPRIVSLICLLLAVVCCGCLAQGGAESPSPESPSSASQPPVSAEFDPEAAAVGLIAAISDDKLYNIYPIAGLNEAILLGFENDREAPGTTIDCALYQGPDERTPLFSTGRSGPYRITEVLAGAEPDGQILMLTQDRLFRYNPDIQVLEDLGLAVPVTDQKALDAAGGRMIWSPMDTNLYIADLPDLAGQRVLWPEDSMGEKATGVRLNESGSFLHFLVRSTPYRLKSVLYHLETNEAVRTQEWRTLPGITPHLVGERVYVTSYEPYVSEYESVQVMNPEGVGEVRLKTPYLYTYGGQNGLLVGGADGSLYSYNGDLSQHQLVYQATEGVFINNCFSTHTKIYLLVRDSNHCAWLLTLQHPYANESQ